MNGRPRISRFPLAALLTAAAIAMIAFFALQNPAPVYADQAKYKPAAGCCNRMSDSPPVSTALHKCCLRCLLTPVQ